MVLIDTTVWIDFFKKRETGEVIALNKLIENGDDVCICGIIYAEVLQGIKNDAEFKKTRTILNQLIYFPTQKHTFDKSVEIYRSLRKTGVTVRGTIDCIIAAVCIEHDLKLLQKDADFVKIAETFPLKFF